MEIPKPTESELNTVMEFLRTKALHDKDPEPKKVRLARHPEERERAWRMEALRFWYLVVMPRRRVTGSRKIILNDLDAETGRQMLLSDSAVDPDEPVQ